MVVRVGLAAENDQGLYRFNRSYDHFYRVLFTDAGPVIPVHFGKEGYRVEYVHQPTGDCT